MFRSNVRVTFPLSLFVLALMCAAFLAPAFAAETLSGTPPQPGAACTPTLPNPEAQALDQTSVMDPADSVGNDWMRRPPRNGFCRCGCGIRCQTSADCDGGSCDPFVTCCTQQDARVSVVPNDNVGGSSQLSSPATQDSQHSAQVSESTNLGPLVDGAQLGGACGCRSGLRCCLDCNGNTLCVRSISQCPECPAP